MSVELTDLDNKAIELATRTLKRAGYADNEEDLLRAINENKSSGLVYWAVIGLKKFGTKRSVDTLKQLSQYPKEDIKTVSVITLSQIAGETETPFYASLLDNQKYKDKIYPMKVLSKLGDQRAVPVVMHYANKVLARRPKWFNEPDDYWHIVRYLERFSQNEEASELIVKLKQRINQTSER